MIDQTKEENREIIVRFEQEKEEALKDVQEEIKYLKDSLNSANSELEGVSSLYSEAANKYNDLFKKFGEQSAENSKLITERDELTQKLKALKEIFNK